MDEKKRYQIFVSSTFTDLEVERGKVMETILNFDCFPAGMELFPAMDEEQFEYIKRIIDDSDYYMLIIGGRYGSEDSNGISWTEKEFDYAVSKGIPVIAFDHKDFTQLLACRTDQDDKKRRKLVKFKNKVATGRLIVKWTNADDLALAVAKSLKKVLELQPRIGWVRADSVASGNAQKEIDSLKKEIVDRQDEARRHKTIIEGLEAALESKDTENLILESKYNAAQQDIGYLNERINALEVELERYKKASMIKSQSNEFTVRGVSFRMIRVEGGTFMMGADDKDADPDEGPLHEVTLSDYWIGETQVTQELWKAVMGENPSHFKSGPNLPVESVSWVDCKAFIRKLNKLTGYKFQFPTEAQWEFAARGGNLGMNHHYLYSGSNYINDVAWFEENSRKKTHPVGEIDSNELGIYDMSGNLWEWCSDCYDNYSSKSETDPICTKSGSKRVRRGGSWNHSARNCRVSYRSNAKQEDKDEELGLRLAL